MVRREHEKKWDKKVQDSNDELASIASKTNLEPVYDEIQNKEIGEVTQFEENRTLISGLEINE